MERYDLIVVGGGFSGFGAAISASRAGLKVLLVEKSNCLGGAGAGALVTPFMPTVTELNGEKTELCRGIFLEIREELERQNGISYGSFDTEKLKLILNRISTEAGVDILFHATLIDAKIKDGVVSSVTLATVEGNINIEADYFIDATGDAQLSYLLSLPYQLGREGDSLCQPMTLSFRLGGVSKDEFYSSLDSLQIEYKLAQARKEISNPRENILVFNTTRDDVLHFNTTRVVKKNPTSAREKSEAEIIAREQVFELYDFMKKHALGLEKSYVLQTGSEIGVRESRKIIGEYVLTGKDEVECTKFDDSIAVSNYDIDIHNPEGSGTSHHYFKKGEYFTIPYRALIPRGTKNILAVGRCISCDHEAQASIRIMPIVTCIGEAGGTAISQAHREKKATMDIDIRALQKELIKNGAFIGI